MYIIWFAGLKKELEAGDKKAVESRGSCSSWWWWHARHQRWPSDEGEGEATWLGIALYIFTSDFL